MIESNRSKQLKYTNTNLHTSNNNIYPPLSTISSYFPLLPHLTKTSTPTSILIKQIKI